MPITQIIKEIVDKIVYDEDIMDIERSETLSLVAIPSPDEGGYLYLDVAHPKPANKFAGFTAKRIVSHRKRGKAMKFQVVFEGFSERGQAVELEELEQDHPQALADYIIWLERNKPKSYQPLIKNFPRLLKLVKC